jgi:lambda repressor-like predicted transcriptional regulator
MGSVKPLVKGEATGLFEVPESWMQSTQDIQRLMMGGVNSDGSLKPQVILALLKYHGTGTQEIGKELGISHSQVRDVITRRRSTPYVQDAIAARIHMNADRAWGRK